jgi:hypothetical protein
VRMNPNPSATGERPRLLLRQSKRIDLNPATNRRQRHGVKNRSL